MLDTQIANQKSEFLTPLGESVKTYGSHWHQLQELKNKHQIEEGCLVFSEGQSDIHRHSQTIENIEQRLSSLSHANLTPRSGPIASALDTILNKHRITPQAYHSRSFVGNHCHKYLQENVYTELTETIVKQTQALTRNPFLIDEVCTIQITFNRLNEAFSKVHNAISHTKHIDQSRLPEIKLAIENYYNSVISFMKILLFINYNINLTMLFSVFKIFGLKYNLD